jgi:hypothetical protein
MAAAADRSNGEVRPAMVPKGTLAAARSSVPRPPAPLIGRGRCCGRVQGPRARSVRAPVARSSGERTVRQHAALPGRMPRVLA